MAQQNKKERIMQNKGEEAMENKGENRMMIKRIVTREIKNLGMPAHIKGYEYVREAIMLVIEDRDSIYAVTKEVYPKIAKKFDTN